MIYDWVCNMTDDDFMRLACGEASRCASSMTAYNVGAVVVGKNGAVLATGYSRELPGNTHAEECALAKLAPGQAVGSTMYSTMEPCSRRLSGAPPCAGRIIEAGVARVVIAIFEPPRFVANCEGVMILRAAGVQVRGHASHGAWCNTRMSY